MTAKKENVKTTSNMTYHSILAPNVTTSVYTTISATTPLLSGGYGGKPSVTGNNGAVMSVPHGENTVRIEKTATLDIQGRVKINGEWLDDRLGRIELMLHIPTRDVIMEEKYSKLKNLWEQYTTELEQYKTWETLKNTK